MRQISSYPVIRIPGLIRVSSLAIYLCFLFGVVTSCQLRELPFEVTQRHFDYPVLKNKAFNHVVQLCVVSDSVENTKVESFDFRLSDPTRIECIERATIFAVGPLDGRINLEKHEIIAESSTIKRKLKLKANTLLETGENFFWLSLTLTETASLDELFTVELQGIKTNRGYCLSESMSKAAVLRAGYAVRKHLDDEVHTYRIPGLVTTKNGTLLGCYDVRRNSSRDLQGDIDIGISRSTNGGDSWEDMRIALDMGNWGELPEKFNGVSDASLLVDQATGRIFVFGLWMFGVINPEGQWLEGLTNDSTAWNHQWRDRGSQAGFDVKETSQFLMAYSDDDGKSWGEPVNLTKMCKNEEWWLWAPAPGNGICLEDGTLVIPTQGRDETGLPFSNITYSRDQGTTWTTSSPAYHNTTESAVLELSCGGLMLNMRDNRNRTKKGENNGRAIAVTHDLGQTWTEHSSSHGALKEPVCMASLFKHTYSLGKEDHSLLVFSNPNAVDGRHHITLKFSHDDGNTWPDDQWILLDEGWGRGYSSLTRVDDEHIGILYEGSQADMVFQRINISSHLNTK